MDLKPCYRCGQPISSGRRKFCNEACRLSGKRHTVRDELADLRASKVRIRSRRRDREAASSLAAERLVETFAETHGISVDQARLQIDRMVLRHSTKLTKEEGAKRKDRLIRSRITSVNSRAKRIGATGLLTVQDWEQCLSAWRHRCAICKSSKKKLTIDHIHGLSHGGTNTADNIRPLCNRCNVLAGKLRTLDGGAGDIDDLTLQLVSARLQNNRTREPMTHRLKGLIFERDGGFC